MSGQTDDQLVAAIASEAELANRAAEIRGDETSLTPELFLKLHPLLCEPIPTGFIQTIPATKGKPYESTGIKSVQVQIDRMNNVLTPLWWWYEETFVEGTEGKVARVEVFVGNPTEPCILLSRPAHGGVNQGSTTGNIYKGSFTNAGKLAFARLGPGHEVYLGAADLDPDVNAEVASEEPTATKAEQDQRRKAKTKIGLEIAGQLLDRAEEIPSAKQNFRLAVSHILNKDIGPLEDRETAVGGLAEHLSFEQAEKVSRWIEKKRTEEEAEVANGGGPVE